MPCELTQTGRGPRILDLGPRRSTGRISDRTFFIVAPRNDRDPFAWNADCAERSRGLRSRRRILEQRHHQPVRLIQCSMLNAQCPSSMLEQLISRIPVTGTNAESWMIAGESHTYRSPRVGAFLNRIRWRVA